MTPRIVPGLVKKAFGLLEADPAHAWTVGKIAVACGVGRRTLQRQFRRFIGRAPMAFLRDLRLDEARQALLCPSGGVTVTDVAGHCGFKHFGRFAAQDRKRFGEAPSATLRRQQHVLAGNAQTLAPLPMAVDRLGSAVVPFDLIGAEAGRTAGFADEIVAALIRLRWMMVTAPGRAGYHLRGKVRGDGTGRLRVTAVLIEAPSGRHLWADRWDGDGNDVFGFGERVAARIATAMPPVLRDAEIDRARRDDPAALNGWDLTMRALPRVLSIEADAEERAL